MAAAVQTRNWLPEKGQAPHRAVLRGEPPSARDVPRGGFVSQEQLAAPVQGQRPGHGQSAPQHRGAGLKRPTHLNLS